ncbi:SAM-dependent methyltransferase [Synechococcus sp. BS56D]|jgi:ubiquinone/menaquinone biosynthesis C-methylase UbiE|uniref:class I SAM-dependent methyltransferase n=1 Tax=Synechococcus sp. BS56D TaxID=2055944 RepID=UPI00103A8BE1|nr:class I SAM-dependent methyltransferase [Synechococcus sp. BS56D]TCD58605.1 SAM-dependent methyltransferase [Synechococcus sp. BS56D]
MATPSITEIAYRTLQQSRSIAGLAHKEFSTRLMEWVAPDAVPSTETVPEAMFMELRRSLASLEDTDWQEAESGLYPKRQLFDQPWIDWAARYPRLWLDLPSTWMRRQKRNVRDLPDEASETLYPDYYLQNFHHQTDGYLSDHSAELYDLQVDILFNGAADAMRRRVLAPLLRGLRRFEDRPAASLRVLDVATGTGRTLHQIRAALPEATLTGIDLSEAYLRQANRWLNQGRQGLVQLLKGNGEHLPFADGSMQAVTCVFLLHELPAKARQAVLEECYRVLEPGGVLVLADSIQLADSPQFSVAMENFRRAFHEPYYADYIRDDIEARLSQAGFRGITGESHFMARVWSASKGA